MVKSLNIVICLVLFISALTTPAFAVEKIEAPATCQRCGMSRAYPSRNRMLVVYADGVTIGTCSLHCTAAMMRENNARLLASVKVADFRTGRLIDARTATWVIGSKEKGTMSSVAKVAFATRQEALAFVKGTGGVITSFIQALNLAGMENVPNNRK